MIKINIICVGKLNENFLKDAQSEYSKRLKKYCVLNITEVKESKIQSFDNEKLIKKTLDEEADNIMKLLNNHDFIILLDLHGNELNSVDIATKFSKAINSGISNFVFIIGGSLGLSDKLRELPNIKKIKLSSLTFTHQMTRIILLEQIYRSFKILNNESYHH